MGTSKLVGYGTCPFCKKGGNLATIWEHAQRCMSNPEYKKKFDERMKSVIVQIKESAPKNERLSIWNENSDKSLIGDWAPEAAHADCPVCGALPGNFCREFSGKYVNKIHAERIGGQ